MEKKQQYMSILVNNIKVFLFLIYGDDLTENLFPSYILEPKKIIEAITWFLNPIEKPPQKFMQLTRDSSTNIYSDYIKSQDYEIKNTSFHAIVNHDEKGNDFDTWGSNYNLIFSLANEKIPDSFDLVLSKINRLLKPSSYFILELKLEKKDLDYIQKVVLESFDSVNFLIPLNKFSTNPFTPIDFEKSNYCWMVALTHSTDEDPASWMDF